MRWFGYRPFAKICNEAMRAETPLRMVCSWCDEPIALDENGFIEDEVAVGQEVADVWHHECYLRVIHGGVNHQAQLCTCYGGTLDSDPPEMTRREAARAAMRYAAREAVPAWWPVVKEAG